MCVVSNIGDHYGDRSRWPWKPLPPVLPNPQVPRDFADEWRRILNDRLNETDDLKARIAKLEELLQAGKRYDAETGQPDCELAEKRERIEKLAKELGVEINFP